MNIQKELKPAIILFFCLLSIASVCTPAAGETRLTALITSKVEYNDNILFSRNNIIDDTTLQISPGLEIGYGTEVLNLESGLSTKVLRYREHTELDNEYLSADVNAAYRPAETVAINAGGSVVNDTTLDMELEETGILLEKKDRETFDALGGITWYAGERSSVSVDYSFTRVDYDTEEYSGYEGDSMSVTYLRSLSNIRDSVTLKPYYSRNDSDTYSVENTGLYAGWSREIDEMWSVSAFLGVRHTATSYLLLGLFRFEDEKTGWLGDLSLKKKGEIYTMEAGLSRELTYSIYGDPIQTDRFRLDLHKNITERLSEIISGSLARGRSVGEFSGSLKRDSWEMSLSSTWRYRIAEELYLDAGYSHSYAHNRLEESLPGVDRNILKVSLSYGFMNRFD